MPTWLQIFFIIRLHQSVKNGITDRTKFSGKNDIQEQSFDIVCKWVVGLNHLPFRV